MVDGSGVRTLSADEREARLGFVPGHAKQAGKGTKKKNRLRVSLVHLRTCDARCLVARSRAWSLPGWQERFGKLNCQH